MWLLGPESSAQLLGLAGMHGQVRCRFERGTSRLCGVKFSSQPGGPGPSSLLGAPPPLGGGVLAPPAASHFSLANQVLGAGKHVFVEKPLATKVVEVDELSRRAAVRNLIVMTGHTFVYN